jgi:uncharacterized protein (TIGR03083 family)
MTTEAAAAYGEARRRMIALIREHSGADDKRIPSCPDWTPKDLAAHLAGVCTDILTGRIEGVGTDDWTAVQVAERRDRTMDDLLAEWEEAGPKVEELLPLFPKGAPSQLLFDTLTHEIDLCEAFGLPAPEKTQSEGPALDFAVGLFLAKIEETGAPPLEIVAGDRAWSSNNGGEATRLRVEPIELLRALTGRRTAEEISGLDWGGADPSPWVPAFEVGYFKLRQSPVLR